MLQEEVDSFAFPDTLNEISKFVFTDKYARYLPDQQRRETWIEAVDRVEAMHLRKFAELRPEWQDEIKWAFDMVRDKRVAPSMRSMQFGGPAVEAHNARLYNCCVRHIDSIRSFAELFYLLLCGCGTGIGLSYNFLNRLPDLVGPEDRTGTVITYVVQDDIEGWADSAEALLMCYFKGNPLSGRKIVFDYSKIRPEGSILKTGGGRAPGHEGLKAAHRRVKALLDNLIEVQGKRRLRSVDAYDVMMFLADAVLSGGVRRSATCIMFDKDDEDMLMAKTGDWLKTNNQRKNSNNSVILLRDEIDADEFAAIVERTKEWGEPGFVFANDPRMLYNPCFEVSFLPVTDDGVCGVQFCNLTTINGAKIKTLDDYLECAKAAALIGTLQAAYTDFPYLSHTAKQLTEEEALLGVSITAMLENPDVLLAAHCQQAAAEVVKETNLIWAARIGINPAARTTVIKPEGTSSLVFKTMLSGIHGAHAYVMWRRIQCNRNNPVYQFFRSINPDLCEASVWSTDGIDDVITFPVIVPETAIIKSDLSALEHLDIIKSTQQNWVVPGTTDHNKKPIHHNVSCTVQVRDTEWEAVIDYLYRNRDSFAAVSLLGVSGDKQYAQAPNEAVNTEEELATFIKQMKGFIPVDYTYMVEREDGTSLMQELACAGPIGCELR